MPDVTALADAVPDRYKALIVFAAGMGLRQGECLGLTADQVDFLRKQVRVDRQLTGAKAGVPIFGPPKSQAGFRTVPMPEVVSLGPRGTPGSTPAGANRTGVHEHALATPSSAAFAARCGTGPRPKQVFPGGRRSTT